MTIKTAIIERLANICTERGVALNELAVRSGVTPSTVYSAFDSRRKDMSVNTLKKLCDGLDMSITDFFNADIFRRLEQEIR